MTIDGRIMGMTTIINSVSSQYGYAFPVLDKTKVKEVFELAVPYWTDSLKKCMKNIMKE